jgi:hypothetical protein
MRPISAVFECFLNGTSLARQGQGVNMKTRNRAGEEKMRRVAAGAPGVIVVEEGGVLTAIVMDDERAPVHIPLESVDPFVLRFP